MKTSDFDYKLPEELIAKYPPEERGTTRLLIVDRKDGSITHRHYSDLVDYVENDDLFVLNETKVINARIFATVKRSGKRVELLFIKPLPNKKGIGNLWYSLIGRAKNVKIGDKLLVENSNISLTVADREEGERGFQVEIPEKSQKELFTKYGHVPLPPYMNRADEPEDEIRYNTVFARDEGSVAAPTASLNLTVDILQKARKQGADISYVTLDVGWGTFAPVNTENIEDFQIHRETFDLPKETADKINNANNVWTFGTTATRTVESCAVKKGGKYVVEPKSGDTNLFIYPGYEWKIIDRLVTNFHAPKSSLIMLVSARLGYDLTMHVYDEAVKEKYNFLSYGDSMLIL